MSQGIMPSLQTDEKPLQEGFEYHVFLSHSHHDSKEKDEIINYLKGQRYKCCDPDEHFVPGKDVVSNIIECIRKSKKVIVIISNEFLRSTYVNFEVGAAIEREGRTKNVTLIPVVLNVELKDVPAKIRRQNVLFWKDLKKEHFQDRLMKAIEVEELSTLVPAGEIAHGLAWSYFYGYLNLVLPGMRDRVRDSKIKKDEDLKDVPFLDKMMITLPHSGYCPNKLEEDDENLQFVGHIPYKASRAGNQERDYKSSVYKVTDPDDPDKQVLVIAEFATPLMSMYEMEQGQIAGLSKPELLAQKLQFEEKLKEILDFEDNKTCHSTYVFCPFDDPRDKHLKPEGWRLSKVLANRAFEELEYMKRLSEEKQKQNKEA